MGESVENVPEEKSYFKSVDIAVEFCGAASAGISLEEADGSGLFR
jgi:hypothetical protein